MQDSKGVLTVGLGCGIQQHQVDIVFANWRTGEMQTVQPKRVTFKHARQMPALVQVLDAHTLAAEGKLGTKLPYSR